MSYQAGDKVQYVDRKGKWRNGVIHGVRKAEAVRGPDIVLGYLIDTGKVDSEIVTKVDGKTGKVLETQPQPQQIDVLPDEVRDPEK